MMREICGDGERATVSNCQDVVRFLREGLMAMLIMPGGGLPESLRCRYRLLRWMVSPGVASVNEPLVRTGSPSKQPG